MDAMETDKFCLRWNDFESNISSAFRELREDKDFFDVTLACEDDQIEAHKVILSACSPFFKTVFKRNRHQHPLLYLKGVKFTDLVAVLNFMYHGEVNVAQDELNNFLAVAEDLRVKGLSQNTSLTSDTSKFKLDTSMLQPLSSSSPTFKHRTPKESSGHNSLHPSKLLQNSLVHSKYQHDQIEDDEIQEVLPTFKTELGAGSIYTAPGIVQEGAIQSQSVTHHSLDNIGLPVSNGDDIFHDDGYDFTGYRDSQSYNSSIVGVDEGVIELSKDVAEDYAVREEAGKYSCKLCSYIARDKYNVRKHLEGKHGLSAGYQCDVCKIWVQSKQKLSQHKLHCLS